MKRNFKVLLLVSFIGVLMISTFTPNRLNRYVKRKIRAYTAAPKGISQGVMFQKTALGNQLKGQYPSLVIGPDEKLYASSIDGKIKQFLIQDNGNLLLENTFKPFGELSKFTIGPAFDPSSNADGLIV